MSSLIRTLWAAEDLPDRNKSATLAGPAVGPHGRVTFALLGVLLDCGESLADQHGNAAERRAPPKTDRVCVQAWRGAGELCGRRSRQTAAAENSLRQIQSVEKTPRTVGDVLPRTGELVGRTMPFLCR